LGPEESREFQWKVQLGFLSWVSRSTCIGQKAVDDDLQYEEDINCDLLENLVTHIPAI